MKDAISEVFETMFFVMVDFPVNAQEVEMDCCESRIGLYEEKVNRQEIALRFDKDFARMLTANLLSKQEKAVSTEELQDAMKELANMVGGSYLSRLGEEAWQLGIPRFMPPREAKDIPRTRLPLSYFGSLAGEICIYPAP